MPQGRNAFEDFLGRHSEEFGYPALEYFFLLRTAFSSTIAASEQRLGDPDRWRCNPDEMWTVAKRLRGVKITIGDYQPVLQEPGDNVWIYIDPPYIVDTLAKPRSKLYAHSFTWDDHMRLAREILACKHRVLLSYDNHPYVRELYQDGFWIVEDEWLYSNNSNAKGEGRVRPRGQELFISNYPPEEMVECAMPVSHPRGIVRTA